MANLSKSLIEGFHTNLALRDVYSTIKPGYMVSITDSNLNHLMVLRIHTSGLKDLMVSSDGISIQYKMIYKLIKNDIQIDDTHASLSTSLCKSLSISR